MYGNSDINVINKNIVYDQCSAVFQDFCRYSLSVQDAIGLHPLDVETLLEVFKKLIGNGATVIAIEHDLDVIRNADYVIDMGPGSGVHGGKIIAAGTPMEICECENSKTGRYLK